MNPERLIEFGDERGWQLANPFADPRHGHRADLLGLRFRVAGQPRLVCGQQDLERVDAGRVRGHRHHGDDAATQTRRDGPGPPSGPGPSSDVSRYQRPPDQCGGSQ